MRIHVQTHSTMNLRRTRWNCTIPFPSPQGRGLLIVAGPCLSPCRLARFSMQITVF